MVPAHNEQAALETCIRRLHAHLSAPAFPFTWRIVIADSASTDATSHSARALACALPGVAVLPVALRGRGRALRAAWAASTAEVVAYMDVDLSTDLRALLPLTAAVVSGHSDLAIGTRLAHGACVARGAKRESLSRAYNRLVRLTLRTGFSDAQCGFKAGRTEAVQRLLPRVVDEQWFFDTELLTLAERDGLRIHEVPVDWTDDLDSRVDIFTTIVEDLRGIVRLMTYNRIATFATIGVLSTVAYGSLFLTLRAALAPTVASAGALALTTIANTAANRRMTFGIRGRHDALRHHLLAGMIYLLTLALTAAALGVLGGFFPRRSHLAEAGVTMLAGCCATVTRYVAMRWWIFAPRRASAGRRLSSAARARAVESGPL